MSCTPQCSSRGCIRFPTSSGCFAVCKFRAGGQCTLVEDVPSPYSQHYGPTSRSASVEQSPKILPAVESLTDLDEMLADFGAF